MTDMNNKKATLNSIIENERISTQELLQQIYNCMAEGVNEFEINASGQHNIGGPLWSESAEKLKFKVTNPGQRVGSMGLSGTQIIIEGPAPADIGWLNSGAEIIVKGDGGDTTAHCAASGKIYVGGKTGARSGALMKQDPKFSVPEFWVLKNTGSFSFEFMGGGIAVVCGYGCENLDSVLGNRSCVGMVGGTVYARGPVSDVYKDVWIMELDESDKEFLKDGLIGFLGKIDRPELYDTLINFDSWHKIVAKTYEERKKRSLLPIKDFREQKWVEGGIFGDVLQDDYAVSPFVGTGDSRLRVPEWRNSSYSAPCEYNCPVFIPTQKRIALLREGKYEEALKLVLDYSPFPASVCGQVCPNLCMEDCNRQYIDMSVKVAELGMLSSNIKVEMPKICKDKKIAVIGAGAAGLTSAWHLRKMGYEVTVFEKDKFIGGKLKQVIPEERLDAKILDAELARFSKLGITVKIKTDVNNKLFNQLKSDYDAVVVAVGAHNPVIIPFEGHEKLVKGLEFLKEINNGNTPKVGEKVVVIGAGNAAMDVVIGAYQCGAKDVTAIDIQKPAAFEKEIQHAKKLGAKILYPCFTDKITEDGVVLKDGTLLKADTVIISVGDRPDFSFLPKNFMDEKGRAKVNEFLQSEADGNVFIPGDANRQGLFTNAIGDGRKVAINIDNMLNEKELDSFEKAPMIPRDKVKTQYYPGLNNVKVQSLDAEQEKDRCLSCGFCRDCEFCENICPQQAISRVEHEDGAFEYVCDSDKCIGCGICAGVCPCGVWTMKDNFIILQEA